jgi:preprotein translocase subunit YajC
MTAREALDMSIREIRAKIEQHEQLLGYLETGDRQVAGCGLHGRHLKAVLLEAVEVLENSRKAFKSKELEALRKKLIGVLADDI